jgi:excinuclease ABC subunit B
MDFKLRSPFQPTGDQPKAIEQLVKGIKKGYKHQTLLGVTGSGKTFTIANVIQEIQKPTLVIAPNKTLAAQLCNEYREFFPKNAVEYFVSYYDYYQPEAYLPSTDTYIEKEAMINDEIDRLRHSATSALLSRRDVIIVASVSCIYNIGSPRTYEEVVLTLKKGDNFNRQKIIKNLIEIQYNRVNAVLKRGTFRWRGQTLEIMPIALEVIIRVETDGGRITDISEIHPLTRKSLAIKDEVWIYPARHYIVGQGLLEPALKQIKKDLEERVKEFEKEGKFLEAERLSRRTKFDLEMIREIGYCNGIENYSRYFDGRRPGDPPYTLLEYFLYPDLSRAKSREQSRGIYPEQSRGTKDFLLIIDESHIAVPQIGGMFEGDRSRKETLVEHGFRLSSALDNRPLKFDEFEKRVGQVIYTSATPAKYEKAHSQQTVEQIIRPTGLVDPEVIIKPAKNQIDDLKSLIHERTQRKERVLVTTLTTKMAEDLTEYLQGEGIKVKYLHHEVETLERILILQDLRKGEFDVLVGVNLLREGLDLPEVSLVAILDADKEGFLRSETSLIQTIGRAARNVLGQVVLYADEMTGSMERALSETNRRRKLQVEYNQKHNITPQSIKKAIRAITDNLQLRDQKVIKLDLETLEGENIVKIINQKEKEMKIAAKNLQFELAAVLRDEIIELNKLEKENKKVVEIIS